MKVFVIGGGGREHALVWKLLQSPLVTRVYCAPGNAGIAQEAECIPIGAEDIAKLLEFARQEKPDLTVVGPEAPLNLGLADRFAAAGLTVCGASQKAALIEGSKAFSKELMAKYGIPTGEFRTFTDRDEAARYLKDRGAPICVKADGLAAGKGVIPAQTLEQALAALDLIMVKKAFGAAGHKVVIEEFLTGEEASFLAFSDGEHVIPLPTSQDHKPIFDHDQGPNTGGMGAYSPAPVVTPALHQKIMAEVMAPTIRALASEGRPYQGVLYAGLMIKDDKIQVLEFNARFGDPEAQPLLMRMDSDLAEVLLACVKGGLHKIAPPVWSPDPTVCVVMASEGYPGSYEKGKVIHGLEEVAKMATVKVFHAGTARANGRFITAGGRVLGVTARAQDIPGAIKRAYEATRKITWEGVHYRSDIGKKALTR
jgi:phosphoribosylamine---glycine ligase